MHRGAMEGGVLTLPLKQRERDGMVDALGNWLGGVAAGWG